MCEQCRVQEQNPNAVTLVAHNDAQASVLGALAVIWNELSEDDLDSIGTSIITSDTYFGYIENNKTGFTSTYEFLSKMRSNNV